MNENDDDENNNNNETKKKKGGSNFKQIIPLFFLVLGKNLSKSHHYVFESTNEMILII